MNDLINNITTMSSREISELTGKRHDHVVRDIDTLNKTYKKIALPKVGECFYTLPKTGVRQYRCFNLTKMQTLDLISSYKTECRIKVTRHLEQSKPLVNKELTAYDKSVFNTGANTITSLEIAEMAGKNHFDLMRDVRNMEQDWVEIGESKFTCTSYFDVQGKSRPMYLLNKEESLYIITKFSNKVRAKLIKRWKELEEKQNKPNLPTTHIEALKSYLLELERNEKLVFENKQQSETIQIQAPIVEYHNVVLDSSTAHPITYIAKELGMTAMTLNKKLHDAEIQYRQGDSWFLYVKYQDFDYTKISTNVFKTPKGGIITRLSTKWTEKGRKFIHKLHSEGKL